MPKPNHQLKITLAQNQRLALLGRMRMAEWIQMPEREFVQHIKKLEMNPLFQKLFYGSTTIPKIIQRRPWKNSRLSSNFYEFPERTISGEENLPVEEKLLGRDELLSIIRRMGQADFERFFVRGDEMLTLAQIAEQTNLTEQEIRSVHEFLLQFSSHLEFSRQGAPVTPAKSSTCLARFAWDDDKLYFEFYSLHWSRGLYQIRYDLLDSVKNSRELTSQERRQLRHLLKRIETINLRQNTIYRILESLGQFQTNFLKSRNREDLSPMSLRFLSRRLDLAPSTVSRAIHDRSVSLPWGEEVPLITLLPGRRPVVRALLLRLLGKERRRQTDIALSELLRRDFGVQVSRRTINAVRLEIQRSTNS
ncbi:MAG: hypothetical protein HY547_00935 [Elusimicrobia bacterium]|nr:hypothetical protein [Elusimicrobiota bacterium]